VNRPSAFISLSHTLRTIAQEYGLQSRMLEQRLRRDWSSIVGEPIARHTHPDAIRYKKLYLLADHSTWLQHLQFLKPSLIEKINTAAGEAIITDLVLRVGEPVARQSDAAAPDQTPLAPQPALLAEAEGSAQAIADPELRARWTMVMARALQPRPTRPGRPGP